MRCHTVGPNMRNDCLVWNSTLYNSCMNRKVDGVCQYFVATSTRPCFQWMLSSGSEKHSLNFFTDKRIDMNFLCLATKHIILHHRDPLCPRIPLRTESRSCDISRTLDHVMSAFHDVICLMMSFLADNWNGKQSVHVLHRRIRIW